MPAQGRLQWAICMVANAGRILCTSVYYVLQNSLLIYVSSIWKYMSWEILIVPWGSAGSSWCSSSRQETQMETVAATRNSRLLTTQETAGNDQDTSRLCWIYTCCITCIYIYYIYTYISEYIKYVYKYIYIIIYLYVECRYWHTSRYIMSLYI